MRKIIYTICLIAALLCIYSCEKPVKEPEEPQVPVTFTNTGGEWELVQWKGNDMEGQVFLRLKNKEFTLWQSVGSMYPEKFTGTYNLVEEEGLGMIIKGMYDFSYEFWDKDYVITSLTARSMEWTAVDDPLDVSLYMRTDSFPKDSEN